MTAGSATLIIEATPDVPVDLEPLNCFRCGKFMAMVEPRYSGPRSHAACDALFLVQDVVPYWPDEPAARGRIEEWKRAFPGLPWEESLGSRRPRPNQRAETAQPVAGTHLEVRCRGHRCPYVARVNSVQEIPGIARQHLIDRPGHSFSYRRV